MASEDFLNNFSMAEEEKNLWGTRRWLCVVCVFFCVNVPLFEGTARTLSSGMSRLLCTGRQSGADVHVSPRTTREAFSHLATLKQNSAPKNLQGCPGLTFNLL